MISQFTQNVTLRAFESDFADGQWKPSGIFVRMQEIAEDHAIALGCGRYNMVAQTGMVWMLTRLHLEMYKYPKITENIVIKTWHELPTRLVFPRHFTFSYPDGEQLGCATSDWVLFNIRDRKLKRPSELPVPYETDPSLTAPARSPIRIRLPQNMQTIEERRVRYSDCDMNIHMNNAKYAEWICDLFPAGFLKSHRLSELDLTYSAEAAIEQVITLKQAQQDERFFVSGETDGKSVFSATGIWKD